MEKEVLIRVRGLHTMDDAGVMEPVEILVPGDYYLRNGKHYLRYEEIMDESGEPTMNLVKITDTRMEVKKTGLANVEMLFEVGKKNMSCYVTPMGMVEMGIMTTEYKMEETEQNLNVEVRYSVDMNGVYVSDCQLSIEAENKEFFRLS